MQTTDALPATWTRICEASEVTPGYPKRVELARLPPLAIFNLDGEFFVTDDTCTHGEASLCDGYVDGEKIECPWHGGIFCIRTGDALEFPVVEPIAVYKVKVFDGAVHIEAGVCGTE